jgi:hypothetical protein
MTGFKLKSLTLLLFIIEPVVNTNLEPAIGFYDQPNGRTGLKAALAASGSTESREQAKQSWHPT